MIPIILITFFASLIVVNAEGNYISPAQLTFKNYPSNSVFNATYCPYDTCYWEFDDRSRGGVWKNYNTTHSFTGVTLVLVNGSLVSDEGNNSILSINFLGNPCYYTQSVEFSSDSYSNHTQNHSFSAYCPISNTDNIGTLTITPNQELVEINMNNGVYVDKYQLSKIKIVQDTWGNEVLRVLYQNNGYWATNEGLLTQVKGILEQNLSKIDITNGYLNTIQGYLQQQKDQAHQDAQQQIQQNQENHDELMNEDIDSTSKQNVDETKYNDYKQKEDTLMQTGNNADLSGLSIGIDTGTSNTIWQLITRIIQSNAKVFGLFISILSIGIIKLALAR